MRPMSYALVRRLACLAALLMLLAVPAWVLADQAQPIPAGHHVSKHVVHGNAPADQASHERARLSKEQSCQPKSSWEERALNQAPTFTDDVKLRVETYTGNSYPQ